jgi:hypothetical protein
MTSNDVSTWKRATASAVPTPDDVQYSPQAYTPQFFHSQDVSTGIVLDQKVLVGLTLILGIVTGVVILLVIDKYSK